MRLYSHMPVIVYGRGDAVPEGAVCVNVTSHSGESWSRKFSPFTLGPVTVRPLGEPLQSLTVENAWQYSKRYREYKDDAAWLAWAKAGFASAQAHRYPFGKARNDPLGTLHNGRLLGYVEARHALYAPMYAEAV